jgi:hypothetical protein
MITTQFYFYTDDQTSSKDIAEQIIERFKSDYPEATSETNFNEDEELFTITLTTEDGDVEDIDTFLCEEICQENEFYCSISDQSSVKAYYFDEEDEWIYKN